MEGKDVHFLACTLKRDCQWTCSVSGMFAVTLTDSQMFLSVCHQYENFCLGSMGDLSCFLTCFSLCQSGDTWIYLIIFCVWDQFLCPINYWLSYICYCHFFLVIFYCTVYSAVIQHITGLCCITCLNLYINFHVSSFIIPIQVSLMASYPSVHVLWICCFGLKQNSWKVKYTL